MNHFSVFKNFKVKLWAPPPPPPTSSATETKQTKITEDEIKELIELTTDEVIKKCKPVINKVWIVLTIINVIMGLVVSSMVLWEKLIK